jgi:hypothetical protein
VGSLLNYSLRVFLIFSKSGIGAVGALIDLLVTKNWNFGTNYSRNQGYFCLLDVPLFSNSTFTFSIPNSIFRKIMERINETPTHFLPNAQRLRKGFASRLIFT